VSYDLAMVDEPTRPPLLATPIGRRRALAVIGSSAALLTLEACGSDDALAPRGWVTADVDPASLRRDEPVTVKFAGTVSGATVAGSAWLVLREADELVAFDPKCPHADCAYELTDDRRFSCLCHEAFFDIDGNVISGPPRRPLDEYRVRVVDGRVELYVPADFTTPRPTG
jgi:nitrite reductase/ring-hydroxylating ferredoxin subunit